MADFDRSAFIGKFQEEAGEYLQRLNEGVIALESTPDDAVLVEQMLRDAHTLKGSSRMVGLLDVSDIAHRLEDVLVRVRDGELAYTPEMSDLFFEALDSIVFLSENAGKDTVDALDVTDLGARLGSLAGWSDGPAAGDEEEGAAESAKPAQVSDEGLEEETAEPAEDEIDTERGPLRRDGALRTKTQHTIRVRTSQVDTLLNLISEAVISRIKIDGRSVELRSVQHRIGDVWTEWSRLRSALGALPSDDERFRDVAMSAERVDDLLSDFRARVAAFGQGYADDASRASAVISDLQGEGRRLRMLPVSTVFDGLPRAVRDLAKEFGKDVELLVEGESTELDKKVLEEISDPLVHIMRNALDHGIESPEEREAAGKVRRGTIRLAARQEGDHIVVEVADDGSGIDPDEVRASAVRKGYLTEAEAASLSDREAVFYIFEPGFSTSAIITEISGRGVGMDVVREYIVDKLKGSLHVESEVGEGTVFTLTIPLTLAIIRALILRVGARVFAIPTSSIEETIRVDPSDVVKVEGREVIRRQRRNIPLVRLGDAIDTPHEMTEGRLPVVVVGFSGHRLGFVVDEFEDEQQIVIKTLGTHLKRVRNVAGVTVLGAGEVVVILNVPDLMGSAREVSGLRIRPGARLAEERRTILVCEDSFTTRELERSIFEAAGYDVEVANDGQQGLERLREGLEADVVVTDVQMPNLGGFDLTRAIKEDETLKQIPVIIVTSLEREEEKAEGIDAGADAYITKSVFNQDTLLDTVERLIR